MILVLGGHNLSVQLRIKYERSLFKLRLKCDLEIFINLNYSQYQIFRPQTNYKGVTQGGNLTYVH